MSELRACRRRLLGATLGLAALAGCGQTGPLYFPEERPAQSPDERKDKDKDEASSSSSRRATGAPGPA